MTTTTEPRAPDGPECVVTSRQTVLGQKPTTDTICPCGTRFRSRSSLRGQRQRFCSRDCPVLRAKHAEDARAALAKGRRVWRQMRQEGSIA